MQIPNLNIFPDVASFRTKMEVLCLSLVVRYLSDYAVLGVHRDDPLRTAHKVSFSSLGMLLQMAVCRGV